MAFERSEALQLLATRRFVPYHYEHENRTFHFGDEVHQLDEVPLTGVLHRSGADLDTGDAEKLLSRVAFASSFNRIHSLPLADVFFKNVWTNSLREETADIMQDVYATVREFSNSGADTDSWSPSRKEFSAHLYAQHEDPSGHAGVFLQTSGICACTKPDTRPDSTYYPIEVMTYAEHNVAKPAERVSLLAGLGHIARRANEYVR